MKEKKSFEEMLDRLQEIVSKMEDGNIKLDESLKYFEEGVQLVKLCQSELDKAEAKIKILQNGSDGEVVEADFEPEKE